MLAPGRTLFLALSWPDGADPAIYFTDPAAAMAAAAALSPAPDVNHPAVVIVYPGVYAQPFSLVSNVHLFGHNVRGCSFTGAVTWQAGVGVNAGQASLFERVYIGRCSISGLLTLDTTGKPLGQGTTFDTRDVDLSGNITAHGRAASGGQDVFQCWSGIMGGTTWSFDGYEPLFEAGVQLGAGAINISNGAFGAAFNAAVCFSPVNLVNTPGTSGQGNKFANVTVDATSVFGPHCGSKCGVVTVASGGSADLRGCEYFTNSNLAGAGVIDRSIWQTSITGTSPGDNVITIAPPLPDGNYIVVVTRTDAAGTAENVSVNTKAGGSFKLNDPLGGHNFDLAVLRT